MDGVPVYRDYNVPAELKPKAHHEQAQQVGWRDILEHWKLVVLDLSEIHGIHLENTGLPWPGIRDRIVGLVSNSESRLLAALN